MTHPYELTYQEFLAAQRLHRRHVTRARISYVLWFIVFPCVFGAFVLWLAFTYFKGERELFAQLAPFVAWLGVMFLVICVLRPYNLRRLFRKSLPEGSGKAVQASFAYNEEGIVSALPGRSEGRFFWNAIVDYAEDDHMVLLYLKKKLFLYVPKSAMSDAEWTELRSYRASSKRST